MNSLREYQPRAFAPLAMQHFAHHPRCALWAKPGMGKTILTLTHLEVLHNVAGESAPTLVLAPLRVARDGWANESRKWQHLRGFEVVPITGDPKQRAAAMRRDAPVYATNYEQLPWLIEAFQSSGKAWPFRTVIADESTKLKSFRTRQGGARARAIAQVAHKDVRRWINLTGTPSPNGLKDLWGQTWFLDEGRRLGRTYAAFEERWFGYRRVKDAVGGRMDIQPVIFPFAQDQIHEKLEDICLTLDPKDWFDLKDPIVSVIEVDLPPPARRVYNEMEREMFTMLAGNEIEAHNAATKSNKCLQLANGAAYVDLSVDDDSDPRSRVWAEVHQEKLDALGELAAETGDDPLLVAYQFKSDRARILSRFPDALDLSDDDHMAAAKRGEGKIWVGHPASMGHGVDGLQAHCNRIVFFSQDWNLEYHDQILERIGPMRQYQEGKDCGVFIDYIVARNTIDEVVMARREGKGKVQDLLLDYMKRKR
jgi:SNF2 family DNA or RNA helicase